MANRSFETDSRTDDGRDDLFDVLSHPHRRFVLQYLRTAETPLGVDELTTELAAWERQRSGADRPGDGSAIELALVHRHLPKMAATEFVGYDAAGRTVTPAARTDDARDHLRTADD